jgi:hypothetical protein
VLHPYQALYFNRVVAGGLPRAAQKFETDYWGSSYKEGVDWLIRYYESPVPVRVANCSIDFLSAYPMSRTEELRRRFVPVRPSRSPDILLATTRWDCHKRSDKILHVVERQGTPLLYVFELGPPPPSSPGTSP